MSGAPALGDADRLELLDGLIYADAFDCALALEELWRYARKEIARDRLAALLREDAALRSLLVERAGLFCLAGREHLLAVRRGRLARARTLERRARRVSRLLRHVPFVRGLTLTGSVAAGDASAGADVDLLVVVAPSRVGTVFLLLGPASRLLGRSLFCPNYYLGQDHLATDESGPYIAHELVQARPVVGGDVLVAANPWVREVFPNVEAGAPRTLPQGSRLQGLFERPLRGRLGERVERRARAVALRRLQAHYGLHGRGVPAEVAERLAAGSALQFHGKRVKEHTLERYEARRGELQQQLAARQVDPSAPLVREPQRPR